MLTAQKVNTDGLTPVRMPAAAQQMCFIGPGFAIAEELCDYIPPSAVLHIRNNGGAVITVTTPYAILCNQGHAHELNVAVAPLEDAFVGPFEPANRYEHYERGGGAKVIYSNVTGVDVAALQI